MSTTNFSNETTASEPIQEPSESDSNYGIERFTMLPQIVQLGAQLEGDGDLLLAATEYLKALKITAAAHAAVLLSLARVYDEPNVTYSLASLAHVNLEGARLENSELAKFALALLDQLGAPDLTTISQTAEDAHVHTEHCQH